MSNWWINDGVLGGYPHIPNIGDYNLTLPFRSNNGWVIDCEKILGYPHRIYRDLEPPIHLPLVLRVELNSSFQFIGLKHVMQIYIFLRHMLLGDTIDVSIINLDEQELYHTKLISESEGHFSLTHDVPASVLEHMPVGLYTVETIVRRYGETESSKAVAALTIHETPRIDIYDVKPQEIIRPITYANNTVLFNYDIISKEVVEQFDFQATLDGLSVSLNSMREFEVMATTVTGTITTSTQTLNVTSPILLTSVAHFVRASTVPSGNTFTLTYTIDGVAYPPIGPFPGGATGNPDTFREFDLPTPVVLNQGARVIQVTSSTNAIRLFQTTVRPQAPEFSIAGTGNIHRMRMKYSVVGATTGTSWIFIDNSVLPESYVISAAGQARIGGRMVPLLGTSLEKVSIQPALIEFGRITQSVSGTTHAIRYVGVGDCNKINIEGFEDSLSGDRLRIKLGIGERVLYSHEFVLFEPIEVYSHVIPGEVFNGIVEPGEYIISVSIERGAFVNERKILYTAIQRPIILLQSITSDLFHLPMNAPQPFEAQWRITGGVGCTFEGSVFIANVIDRDEAKQIIEDLEHEIVYMEHDITTSFYDISNLIGGLYNVVLRGIITHDVYGAFSFEVSRSNAFTVAYEGVPGISLVSLNYPGRYVGAHRDITVTSRLFNIVTGSDQLLYELRDGGHLIHSFSTGYLANRSDIHIYSIPAINFANMRPGIFTIVVSSLRDGQVRQTETVQYEAVQPPTLHFVSANPSEMHLPIDPPVDIEVLMFINGRRINSISGRLEIENTTYTSLIEIKNVEGGE